MWGARVPSPGPIAARRAPTCGEGGGVHSASLLPISANTNAVSKLGRSDISQRAPELGKQFIVYPDLDSVRVHHVHIVARATRPKISAAISERVRIPPARVRAVWCVLSFTPTLHHDHYPARKWQRPFAD
ncbi:hypothetical protein C8F04DRAFT_1393647 [Mycena alexandri]|uniref:Uncharacterized protein n=1 Tax=Mycena alexandri TaxID=1745969 RepID=A0AAD6X761_9AGAR|nr:hypothetical protein C8F04DRAFT_1393647 [Mycena alexandri]